MRHVMLKLETLGTRPGFAVLAIAAMQFDLNGRVGERFYANIVLQSCTDAGLAVDQKTKDYWSQQPEQAKLALLADRKPLREVATQFNTWFYKTGAPCPWGQGASFDPAIWEAASSAVGIEAPWKFWNIRDTRTVYDLFDFDTREQVIKRKFNNALDLAHHQIDCVAAAISKGRPAVSASVFG